MKHQTHQKLELKQNTRLLKAGRPAEAMAVISALEDKPPTDANVKQTFEAIREAVIAEGLDAGNAVSSPGSEKSQSTKASLRELFTSGRGQNFRRVSLGVVIQCFQQVLLPHLPAQPDFL